MSQPKVEKVLDKVIKLMAVTEDRGATEAEAAACAEKVQELLMSANLTMVDVEEFERAEQLGDVCEIQVDEMGNISTWKGILMSGIAKAYLCKFYTCDKLEGGGSLGGYWWPGRKTSSLFMVVGREANTAVSREMYTYLLSVIDALVDEGRQSPDRPAASFNHPVAYWNGFRVGCARRVGERLINRMEEMRQVGTEDGTGTGLAVIEAEKKAAQENAQFLAEQGVHLIQHTGVRGAWKPAYEDGKIAGNDVGIDPQIGAPKQDALQLPGGHQ